MNKLIYVFLIASIIIFCTEYSYTDNYEKIQIKQGMHESTVREKFGDPLEEERIKSGFLPIPKKKALYQADATTYLVLEFFSGRVREIAILEDMDLKEAKSLFIKTE
ncbi:hypothetical protein ACFL3N_00725 [Candidatus Omnitrophota bacterium]